MRKVFPLILLLLTMSVSAQSINEEFRSSWVIAHHWLSPSNSVAQNQALTRQILDNHKAANMTSVLWQVRHLGTVYYPSAYENWGVQTGSSNPGYDPLAYAIEQAHARGLEFHAWFNTFESRNRYSGSPAALHPEWVCRDRDGNTMPNSITWLSPGRQEVREYLVNVAMEIVNNYDVDGLHLDFVRWNEHTNSVESIKLAQDKEIRGLPDGVITQDQYRDMIENNAGRYLYDPVHSFSGGVPSGFSSWEQWWRWSVTEFVSTLHDSIQSVKPWVRLSPAAIGRYNWGGWNGRNIVYQDAALWLNEKYIEQLVGMHYHWDTAGEIYDVLEGGCPNCWSSYIQPAIQDGQMYSVGFFSDNFNSFDVHQAMIDTVRTINWADGFQFFSYATLRDLDVWDEIRNDFFQRKTKIRATGLIDDIAPDSPTIDLLKLDSLQYQVTVNPASTGGENFWYIIYRSEDDQLDVDVDEIAEIAFGNAAFNFVDIFDGLQDFDGSYRYFATTLDRFWNESLPSAAQLSDPIPSFAPTVVFSNPAEGDTISADQTISIQFSKTMDPGSFSNAVSFQPAAVVGSLNWNATNRQVNINVSGGLNFLTDYQLTISADAQDVNGKPIDGDGNGSGGDPFILSFRTLAEDNQGPQIVNSFPSFQVMEENFIIDDVLTVVFNEPIDPSSINNNTLTISGNSGNVQFFYITETMDDKSLLSIQPISPLMPANTYTLSVNNDITDTLGNVMAAPLAVPFKTSRETYFSVIDIEPFTSPGDWWQPTSSGSTIGVVSANTVFNITDEQSPPALLPWSAGSLQFEWSSSGPWLLREYLGGGAPRSVFFDSTDVLQCYVYGDGSNTLFRFAVDDNAPNGSASNHEVSNWITVDWYGWRLVEWDMGDPASVGSWLGNGILQGNLRFDSFQLSYSPGNSSSSGNLIFDQLRAVKKVQVPVGIDETPQVIVSDYELAQNYPNPFNPETTIFFALPESGIISLEVYDLLGKKVATLIDGHKTAGRHSVQFDGSELASGMYIYRLSANGQQLTKRMLLIR